MKECFLYIKILIVVIICMVITNPKLSGLPSDFFDSLAFIFTLIGLILDKCPDDIKHKFDFRDKLINYLFNIKSLSTFWEKLPFIFLKFSIFFLVIFAYSRAAEIRELSASFAIFTIGIAFMSYSIVGELDKYPNANPYLLYYIILLFLYIVSIVHKF